jgi:hypothetical protein
MINKNDYQTPKPIQDYFDFLNAPDYKHSPFVTKDRIDANFQKYGEAMNTLMVYPDIFADIMTPRNSSFSLFFEQRMVLRSMVRSRQSYFTFTRAFSKSFLAFFSRYTICMFLPRHKTFVTAGTKTQAAQIAREKVVDDLWVKFPLLANEMQKFRMQGGKLKTPWTDSGDEVTFNFPNGSKFDVIGGQVRGARRNSGLFEEVIEQDQDYINEVVIPLLNIARTDKRNRTNPYEPQSQKIFVTTAGYQQTFSYDKLVETLCYQLIEPNNYTVMGGSYKILLLHGRLAEQTIRELLSSPSFKPESFDREYRSIWSGALAGAAFNPNSITKLRRIKRAEYKAREDVAEAPKEKGVPHDFYAISCDVAKDGSANTAVIVYRVSYGEYACNYRTVYATTIDTSDFEEVANALKVMVRDYNAEMLIYDANGVGAGLRDWLNKPTITRDGLPMPGYGIINPPNKEVEAILIKYRDPSRNIIYEIKSGGNKGSDIHKTFMGKVGSGNIRFLVKSTEALAAFSKNKNFCEMSKFKKDAIMRPYYFIDQLEMEMKNLDIKDTIDNNTTNLYITRRNTNIQKDFFSAAEYGVYGVSMYKEMPFYQAKAKRKRQIVAFGSTANTIKSQTRNTNNRRSTRSTRRR